MTTTDHDAIAVALAAAEMEHQMLIDITRRLGNVLASLRCRVAALEASTSTAPDGDP